MKQNKQYRQKTKSYLQTNVTELLPVLMEAVQEDEHGIFRFTHPNYPELKVEGKTLSFVQEHLERALLRQFKNQSDKHIDFLCKLLSA